MPGLKKASNNDLEKILGTDKPAKSKMSKKKKIVISSIAIVVAAAITVTTIFIVKKKQNTEGEIIYREYTAERGDILVGLEESSVITLNKETITFPVGAEVLELYVKSGATVSEGDPLVKMSTDDIQDSLSDYEDQIESAETSLEEAKLSRKNELLKAKQDMESTILQSEQSDDKYAQTIAQAEIDLADAEANLTEATEKYDETYALSLTFTADFATLSYFETKQEGYQSTVDYWQNRNSAANEVSQELKNCESEIKAIVDASDMAQAEAILDEYKAEYERMETSYNEGGNVKYSDLLKYKDKVETLENSMSELENLFTEKSRLETKAALYDTDNISSKLSAAQENLNTAKEQYENARQDFQETYGNIESKEDMDKSLSDAEKNVEKAKLKYENQKTQYNQTLLQAEQTKTSSVSSGNNAQTTYNLKKLQLDEKVKEAQDNLTSLREELSEIKESLSNDGIIKAPCDGIVSSISVEEGDEISTGNSFGMSNSATIMTITDMSEVYVSVSISEDEILDIYLDQEAVVSLDAFSDETFDAVVDSISVEGSTMGAATVTYTVSVKFTQEGHELYEGMSADVTLITGSARDCIYISKQAITTKDGASYVYLKGDNDEKIETKVSTGFTDGQYTEILSGLSEGDVCYAESGISTGKSKDSGMPEMPENGNFDFDEMPSFDAGSFGGNTAGASK